MDGKSKPQKSQAFIESIRSAIPKHCSNCGTKYQDEDLALVQKDEFTAVLHLTCSNCKESYLINVVTPLGILQGASRMPLRTDINSPDEAKKFIGQDTISSEDILSIHEAFKKELTSEQMKVLLTT